NVLSRLAHYVSFIISSFFIKHRIPKPDVVIASSPPLFVGIIGVIFKKLWHVPFILDIRDLWPESVESVGAVKNKKLLRQAEKLAHWIYKNAAHITVTSPGIQKKLTSQRLKILPAISIIPNGAELDLFKPDISGSQIRHTWNLGKNFVVLYTGNLGLAQAPEIFIKTAEILKKHTDISLLIVGAGVLLEKLQIQATKKSLKNIIFTGNQPRSKMPHFVAAADICIIPYKAADTFRNTFPSKMFDYMAGARPIIINLKGEASELIDQAKCGVLAKEEDPQDLATHILKLKEDEQLKEKLGISGKNFVEENYRREIIAVNLGNVIIKACNR
ncbi:MAG: glycosyltransferase family 4 protein, partial [Patescibacteria group bacterium]